MTAEEIRAGEIVIDAVAPFVAGLFTKRSPEQRDWTFATGTAIEFRAQKFILTAGNWRSFVSIRHRTFRPKRSMSGRATYSSLCATRIG